MNILPVMPLVNYEYFTRDVIGIKKINPFFNLCLMHQT